MTTALPRHPLHPSPPGRPFRRGRSRTADDLRAARLADLVALRDHQRTQAAADAARLAALR